MRKEDIEKVKILNSLIKIGNIANVESYIKENNIKIDQYFYIMSSMKDKDMLNFILSNMSRLKFRVRSKRKILDKMLDLRYYEEFIFFLKNTSYEKFFESERNLAKRVARTNNDFLIIEFLKIYKNKYYMLDDFYNVLISNKRFDLIKYQEKREYKFICSYLKNIKDCEKIVEEHFIEYKNVKVKKVIELYYSIKKYDIEEYQKISFLLNNIEIKELLIKIFNKKNKIFPKDLEKYYLDLQINNF